MIVLFLIPAIMLVSQTGPTASAPSSLAGITAEAFAYDHEHEAQRVSELVGDGQRTESVGPGWSGEVRSVVVRSEAGVTMVLMPVESARLRRPEMCRTFIPIAYRPALLEQEPAATTAAQDALKWCLQRVSPLIVHLPTIRPPAGDG